MTFSIRDNNGELINDVYQHDIDRVIVVSPDEPIEPEGSDSVFFHFATAESDVALVVKPTRSESGQSYTATIPNEILEESNSIKLYVFVSGSVNGSVTVGSLYIPVVPRPISDGYSE